MSNLSSGPPPGITTRRTLPRPPAPPAPMPFAVITTQDDDVQQPPSSPGSSRNLLLVQSSPKSSRNLLSHSPLSSSRGTTPPASSKTPPLPSRSPSNSNIIGTSPPPLKQHIPPRASPINALSPPPLPSKSLYDPWATPTTSDAPASPLSSTRRSLTIDVQAAGVIKKKSNNGLETDSPVTHTPPPPPPPPRDDRVTHRVLYDYDAPSLEYLSVKAGEFVRLRKTEPPWCVISVIRLGVSLSGLVPLSYIQDLVAVEERTRPVQPKGFLYGTRSGFMRDVVAVLSADGSTAPMTNIVARFWGASASKDRIGSKIQVFLDGKMRFELEMGTEGKVVMPAAAGSTTAQPDLVRLIRGGHASLTPGPMHIRLEHLCADLTESPIRFAEAVLWVWRHDDVCVVSDVDGTITRSDIAGHINTTLLQKMGYSHNGYAHEGVCALYAHLVSKTKCRIVYVSSRPLDLVDVTRQYIHTLAQGGKSLPCGPVVTDSTTYYGSLRREVVDKTSHVFKTAFLLELRGCFERTKNRDLTRVPVLMAGFGNKETDAMAYAKVGIPKTLTFIIDKRSVISAGSGFASEMDSYDDPALFKWIGDMCTLFMAGKLLGHG